MTKQENREGPTAGRIDVRVDGSGFAVEGPGFYVWDENLETVLAAARELSLGRFPATQRVQRALLLPQDTESKYPARRQPGRRRGRSKPGPGTTNPPQ